MNKTILFFYFFFIYPSLFAIDENFEVSETEIIDAKNNALYCSTNKNKEIYYKHLYDFKKLFLETEDYFNFMKSCDDFIKNQENLVSISNKKLLPLTEYIISSLNYIFLNYSDCEHELLKLEEMKNWNKDLVLNIYVDFKCFFEQIKKFLDEQKVNSPDEYLAIVEVFGEIKNNIDNELTKNKISKKELLYLYNCLLEYKNIARLQFRYASNAFAFSRLKKEFKQPEQELNDFFELQGFTFKEIVKISKAFEQKIILGFQNNNFNDNHFAGTCGWSSYANSYLALQIAASNNLNIEKIKDIYSLPLFFADPKIFKQTIAPACSELLNIFLRYYPTPGVMSNDLANYTGANFVSNNDFNQTLSDIKNALDAKTPVIIYVNQNHWTVIIAYNDKYEKVFLLDDMTIKIISFESLENKMNSERKYKIGRLLNNIPLVKKSILIGASPIWIFAHSINYILPNEYYSKLCCQALNEILQVKNEASFKKYNYLIFNNL